MPRRIRADHDVFEMRGAEVRVARLRRPCDSPVCARHNLWIEIGEEYAYINTGIALCNFHYASHDVVEVSR